MLLLRLPVSKSGTGTRQDYFKYVPWSERACPGMFEKPLRTDPPPVDLAVLGAPLDGGAQY